MLFPQWFKTALRLFVFSLTVFLAISFMNVHYTVTDATTYRCGHNDIPVRTQWHTGADVTTYRYGRNDIPLRTQWHTGADVTTYQCGRKDIPRGRNDIPCGRNDIPWIFEKLFSILIFFQNKNRNSALIDRWEKIKQHHIHFFEKKSPPQFNNRLRTQRHTMIFEI